MQTETWETIRLLGADLITGMFRLDEYARRGTPHVLGEVEQPRTTQARIFETVLDTDLWKPQQPIWRVMRRLHLRGKPVSPRLARGHLEAAARTELDWCCAQGMAIGYDTHRRARQLLTIRNEIGSVNEHQRAAAQAIERLREAVCLAQ